MPFAAFTDSTYNRSWPISMRPSPASRCDGRLVGHGFTEAAGNRAGLRYGLPECMLASSSPVIVTGCPNCIGGRATRYLALDFEGFQRCSGSDACSQAFTALINNQTHILDACNMWGEQCDGCDWYVEYPSILIPYCGPLATARITASILQLPFGPAPAPLVFSVAIGLGYMQWFYGYNVKATWEGSGWSELFDCVDIDETVTNTIVCPGNYYGGGTCRARWYAP